MGATPPECGISHTKSFERLYCREGCLAGCVLGIRQVLNAFRCKCHEDASWWLRTACWASWPELDTVHSPTLPSMILAAMVRCIQGLVWTTRKPSLSSLPSHQGQICESMNWKFMTRLQATAWSQHCQRRDVEEYQKIEEEVHRSISTINGMFSTLSQLSCSKGKQGTIDKINQ